MGPSTWLTSRAEWSAPSSTDGVARLSLVLALALWGAGGCASARPAAGEAGCLPAEGSLPAGFDAGGLAGRFELTLVATRGPHAGAQVEGTVVLWAMPAALRSIPGVQAGDDAFALYGTAAVELERVGALRIGDLDSADPARPGVVVVARSGAAPRVWVRLGSEANRRDVERFDGGYMVLDVQQADRRGFFGQWRSGVMDNEAEGYFCATRR